MIERLFARLTPSGWALLAASVLVVAVPGCDCAGNTGPMGTDAGDTGAGSDTGPPRDGGPDTGARDGGGADTNADTGTPGTDAGGCSNPETCNDMDDDCDGRVDENIVVSCGSDIGICRSGTQTCSAGTLGTCTGGVSAAAAEVCGNGLDDDCNELVDDSCTCTDGATQSCGSGVGECHRGTQTCSGSVWGACVGEVTPTPELCDGLDNNCDGLVDETFGGLGGSCDGPDADMCSEGTLTCSTDHMGTSCSDTTGDSVETCNGTDDDCDGMTDEGCTCTDGATQACGMAVGVCTAGTQTCSGGVWGACSGTGPSMELCDGLDNNCDGSTDEGFALGMMCDGSDADMCAEGMTVCAPGGAGVICGDTTGDSVETCNAMDDNCDGNVDEGFMLGVACDGPDADLCNEGVFACTAGGTSMCNDASSDNVETCNDMDDDCDGHVDEGIGGTSCGPSVGGCGAIQVCVAGAMVCRGTFVALSGNATNPGTQASPLNSIAAAITNAVAIGGGADVCVCDPVTGAAGPSVYTENVAMVEGVSVLGGFDCATWMLNGNATTTVADIDADGLTFPAGITSVTALDRMTVLGLADPTAGATSAAITVTDSSPTLSNDTIRSGAVSAAIGLRVVESTGATAAPTITNGTYSSTGVNGGTATAVSLESSSPIFNGVTIGGGIASGTITSPTTSYGVRCMDCGGTTFTNGSITAANASTSATGLSGTGDLTALALTGTSVSGGSTSGNGSTSAGVSLATCTGAPTFTGVAGFGGGNTALTTPTGTTRTAFVSSGASCAPVIDGGRWRGCEAGVTCVGVEANTGSPLVVRNVNPAPGGLPYGISGTATGAADTTIGLRCLGGGCARITSSTISAGGLTRGPTLGAGAWIAGASPTIDSCRITGPNGGVVAPATPQFYAMYLHDSASIVSNDVLHDGTCAFRTVDLLYDMTPNPSGPAAAPTVVNNTLDYSATTLAAGARVGIAFFSNAVTPAAGIFRNNFVHNLGNTGTTVPVAEANANSDPATFENNALWDPAAVTGVYFDEGTTGLTTAAMINALAGAANDLVVDCNVNVTFHLPLGSMCIDVGTNTTCPAADFEAQSRPFPTTCDIGADEFHP